MPRNTLSDLRNHLFAALEGVVDKDDPLALDRAKAVCDISKQLIESAKVEVAYIKATGETGSSKFIEDGKNRLGDEPQPKELTSSTDGRKVRHIA